METVAGNSVVELKMALRLLDGFELSCGGEAIHLLPGCQRLVALLGLDGPAFPRCRVIGQLWPETSERCAQASLRTDLHRLRALLSRGEVVEATRTHLTLGRNVVVDVHAQTIAVDDVEAHSLRKLDRGIVDRLSGDLLPGWYDEWVVIQRERLRNRRLHALEKLSACFSRDGNHAAAIDAALAALAADPLRETAHRAVVEAHLIEGNRAEASRHWRSYRRLIRERFHQEPTFSWDDIAGRCDETLTAA